jgi:chemotaxis response regulator CheB
MSEKIRVLVVDDSALMRKLIPQVLQRDPSIEVVGTAMDGEVGLRKLEELKPHVVTLDLDMPRMDGLEMLRQITRKHRVPVILVSAQTERGASVTLKALALGAFDFVTKPPEAASGPNCSRAGAEDQGSRRFGRAENDHHGAADEAEGPAADFDAELAFEDRGHRDFHRRSERAAVSIFAAAAGFSRMHSGGAAHARRVYGNVCAAAGRMFGD